MNKWIHININTQEEFTFHWSFRLCPFGILIQNVDLSDRIRSEMTVIDIPHHLSVGADEGPTPFTITGDSFIDSVLNQFTSINGMRRFHQSKQLCSRIINIKFLIRVMEYNWIKLLYSTCIWKMLSCRTNRDSRICSPSSRWHINQLIAISHCKFRGPEF